MTLANWQCDMPDEQIDMLVQSIKSRSYTQGELAYALGELRVDPELDKKLSFPDSRITAADFERHVARLRRLKVQLGSGAKLRQLDVQKLVDEFPTLINYEDFGVCDFDMNNIPLYRYRPGVKHKPITPTLPDTAPPQREGGGTYSMKELMK